MIVELAWIWFKKLNICHLKFYIFIHIYKKISDYFIESNLMVTNYTNHLIVSK